MHIKQSHLDRFFIIIIHIKIGHFKRNQISIMSVINKSMLDLYSPFALQPKAFCASVNKIHIGGRSYLAYILHVRYELRIL